MCQRDAVKVLPPVMPAEALEVHKSGFKDASKDGKTVSQDEILFLNVLKEKIIKNIHGEK